MKVIDVTGLSFTDACNRLADKVVDGGFLPDVVIGIRTGGALVARTMIDRLRTSGVNFAYGETRLQRELTAKKEKYGVRRLLQMLPVSICNVFRNVEAYSRELVSVLQSEHSVKPAFFDEDVLSALSHGTKILIVDDAIDTGQTIKAIKCGVLEKCPLADVRVAVLTVTQRKQAVWPEYYLYSRVLLRFPWSFDAKA